MNKWGTWLGILSAILLGGLSGGLYNNAGAVSPYDNLTVAENLIITDFETNSAVTCDLSTKVGGIAASHPTHGSDFVNADGWMIIREMQNSNSKLSGDRFYDQIGVYFYQGTPPTTQWIDNQTGSQGLFSGIQGLISIRVDDDCEVSYLGGASMGQRNGSFWFYSKSASRDNSQPWIIYNYDLEYPAGYEGILIPDTWSPPIPPLNWIPDINMVNSIDWKITIQDLNFNTFDNVPFTCNTELTPVIQYELYNEDTSTLLESGVYSPTVQYEYQSEKYGIATNYSFKAKYYCGSEPGDTSFTNDYTYYFTLNSSGMYLADTPTCFSDTFPYVDINGCSGVIASLVNNLSFGAIKLPEFEINTNSCHTLGTIGDWINVPSSSRTICPQFSETVRNIVTPFLTFVLGITILTALVTKSTREVT